MNRENAASGVATLSGTAEVIERKDEMDTAIIAEIDSTMHARTPTNLGCGAPCEQFPILSLDELLSLPDPEWLVEGMIFERGFGVMFGKPKSFKSFQALDIALSIATGRPFQGRKVKQGPILYISGEGQGGFKKRVRAWMNYHGVTAQELSDVMPLLVPVDLLDPAKIDQLIAAVNFRVGASRAPIFVVLDTLARMTTSGDENTAKDMGRAVESVQKLQTSLKAAALAVHHGNKQTGEMRGSSALEGAVDVSIRVDKDSGAKQPTVTIKCHNMKDAECFEPIRLVGASVGVGDGQESLVFADSCAPRLRLRRDSRQPDVLRILVQSGENGLTYTEWEVLAEAQGIKATAFKEHVKSLLADGLVSKPDGQRRGARYIATVEGISALALVASAA